MTDTNQDRTPEHCEVYFARLMVALELRQTHGIIFATAFLDQFTPEIGRAAYRAIQLSTSADELARVG